MNKSKQQAIEEDNKIKFNSNGIEKWRSFYRDLFMNIKTIAGGKIFHTILKKVIHQFIKKYENLIKLILEKFIRRTRA